MLNMSHVKLSLFYFSLLPKELSHFNGYIVFLNLSRQIPKFKFNSFRISFYKIQQQNSAKKQNKCTISGGSLGSMMTNSSKQTTSRSSVSSSSSSSHLSSRTSMLKMTPKQMSSRLDNCDPIIPYR